MTSKIRWPPRWMHLRKVPDTVVKTCSIKNQMMLWCSRLQPSRVLRRCKITVNWGQPNLRYHYRQWIWEGTHLQLIKFKLSVWKVLHSDRPTSWRVYQWESGHSSKHSCQPSKETTSTSKFKTWRLRMLVFVKLNLRRRLTTKRLTLAKMIRLNTS